MNGAIMLEVIPCPAGIATSQFKEKSILQDLARIAWTDLRQSILTLSKSSQSVPDSGETAAWWHHVAIG